MIRYQIFPIHQPLRYPISTPKFSLCILQRPLSEIIGHFVFLSEGWTTGSTADLEMSDSKLEGYKFRSFQGYRPNFSPGANRNIPLPKEFCVLKYDWFAVTSIQLLSFCNSAKGKCASDAWQIFISNLLGTTDFLEFWKRTDSGNGIPLFNELFYCFEDLHESCINLETWNAERIKEWVLMEDPEFGHDWKKRTTEIGHGLDRLPQEMETARWFSLQPAKYWPSFTVLTWASEWVAFFWQNERVIFKLCFRRFVWISVKAYL